MIIEAAGDILQTTADVLVVPVNARGVMGAGLARQAQAAGTAGCWRRSPRCWGWSGCRWGCAWGG